MPCSTDNPTNEMASTDDTVSAAREIKSINAIEAWINSKKVADILASKAGATWPKAAKTPAFHDEGATVYLNIKPKKMMNRFQDYVVGFINLPHPLSLNRSVCYIGEDVETEEQQAEMTKKLKGEGVLGKIKTIPWSELELLMKTNDREALAKLSKNYDSFFLCESHPCRSALRASLADEQKCTFWAGKGGVKEPLNTTGYWVDQETDGYIVKVGHTGLSHQQLEENVVAVAKKMFVRKTLFPASTSSVRSMHLKAGNSEAVCIHQDDNDEVEPGKVPAEVIDYAVSTLKSAADWPKDEAVPEFSNEAATVYLNVFPMKNLFRKDTYFGVLRLPHALSLNRSVCYIGQDVETKEKQAEMTEKLKAAGVQGKIKVIPGSVIESAVTNDEGSAIAQLTQLYDSYLVDEQTRKSEHWKKTLTAFLKNRKYAVHALPADFGASLKKSSIWRYQKTSSYVMKVGHAGLTDQQLRENIAGAIEFFKGWEPMFPKGFASIQSIQLFTGTGEKVSIHYATQTPSHHNTPISKKREARKLKRPAEKEQADEPVPAKQQREC